MKQTKSKLSKTPFELLGFTIDEYVRWCNIHEFKSYLPSTKKEFFKRVNNYIIVKRNDKLLENGEEI